MHWQRGDITFGQYVFRPHGAHLNVSVYILMLADFYWANGSQNLLRAVSLISTVSLALFFIALLIVSVGKHGRPIALAVTAAATAGLILCIADSEVMLDPYEVGLSTARFSYAFLLWLAIKAMQEERDGLLFGVVCCSVIAVTFHGTGIIYAVSLVFLHCIMRQNHRRLIVSTLPLLTAVVLQTYFSTGPSELSLSRFLHALQYRGITNFIVGFCSYFAAPFRLLWPNLVGTSCIVAVGGILASITLVIFICGSWKVLDPSAFTVPALLKAFRARKGVLEPRESSQLLYVVVTSLFLLLSAVAATAFWLVRIDLGNLENPVYFYILTSARYGYYGSVTCIMIMGFLLQPGLSFFGLERTFRLRKLIALLFSSSLLFISLYCSVLGARGSVNDNINFALAGISSGLSPLLPDTEAIWPGAITDWYWKDDVPATVKFMQAHRKGPWHDLPALGDVAPTNGPRFLIRSMRQSTIGAPDNLSQCKFEGDGDRSWDALEKVFFDRSQIASITSEDGVVRGYGVQTRARSGNGERRIIGFVRCPDNRIVEQPYYLTELE
jgi:hypothetical protein